MLDPRIPVIPAVRIPPFHSVPYFRWYVVAIVVDMRIEMTPIMIIMRNHLPIIIGASVGKIGVPLVSIPAPAGVARLGIIPLKRPLHVGWHLLLAAAILNNAYPANGQDSYDKKHLFHDILARVNNVVITYMQKFHAMPGTHAYLPRT